MAVHLYLVRHGETPMNKARRLQGFTDAPLTPKGVAAATRLGHLLAPIHFDAAYSSDRLRAKQTAHRILAARTDAPTIQLASGLREYYFGGLEGTTNLQLMRKATQAYGLPTMMKLWSSREPFPGLIRTFQTLDPTGQAETLPALEKRVKQAMAAIVAQAKDDSNLLIVAHGVILSALVYQLAPEKLPVSLLKNTSVTRVEASAAEPWQVIGVNLTRRRALEALQQQ